MFIIEMWVNQLAYFILRLLTNPLYNVFCTSCIYEYQSPISSRAKKRKLVKKLNQSVISSERSGFDSSFRKKDMLNDTNGNIINKCLDESSITVGEKEGNYVTTGVDSSFLITNYGYLASEEKLRNLVKKSRRTTTDKLLKKHEISINDVQNTNNAILNVHKYLKLGSQ
jgi:hypothetical protein